MKYFVPNLELAKESKSQAAFQEKLGGLPFGLPVEMYPICKGCGNPMVLLAQFIHHKERLDLGKDGRILFVFQCNYQSLRTSCSVWESESGANSCFILEKEDLTSKFEKVPEGEVNLEKEFLISEWAKYDDGISFEDSLAFFDEDKYYEFDEDIFEQIIEKITENTRLGGVPYWVQYPEVPVGSWKFIGQLDDLTGFNFGDAGIGYIFIEKVENSEQLPKGKFLWQCG